MAMRSSRATPVRKVAVSGIAASLGTLLIFILNTWVLGNHPNPKDNHLITGELAAAFTTALTFILGYLVPPGDQEQNVPR
jgi:hypothetical protein